MSTRTLADQLNRWQMQGKQAAQVRYATVSSVSSVDQTVTLTFAGSSTPVSGVATLSSYGAVLNDVVAVLQSGSDLLVIGTVAENDVPIGAVVDRTIFPTATLNVGASTTFVNGVITATLIAGHQYELTYTINKGQQVTGAGTGATQFWCTDSASLIQVDSGNARGVIVNSPAIGAYIMGSGTTLVSPSSTASVTFSPHGQSPGTGTVQFAVNTMELILRRVS